MNKKKLITFLIISALCIAATVALVCQRSCSNESEEENVNMTIVDNGNANENDNLLDNINADTLNTSVNEIGSIGDTFDKDGGEEDLPEIDSNDHYPYAFQDQRILANIDEEKAKQVATDFTRNFLTYDAQTLGNGSYKRSWIGDVNICERNSDLLNMHMNEKWNHNVSTYAEVYNRATDITVDTVYVSRDNNGENATVAVSMTVILDENQASPGEMEWEVVNTNRVHYAVYLDQDLKVLDIRRQDAKTLNTNIFNYRY